MKQPFTALRIVLAIVFLANLYFAFIFIANPESVAEIYQMEILDTVHQYLAMTVGALLGVFALGALLPFVKPLKYGSIIIMLLLMHFSIFLVDVVLLSRGALSWTILLPEMIYFLLISTALVRYYPIRLKEIEEIEEKKEIEENAIKEE